MAAERDSEDENCEAGGGLVDGQPVNGVWPEQSATVADPSGTGGMVTPRTAAWVAEARRVSAAEHQLLGSHVWNPTSDHPRGKACDLMVGSDARQVSAAACRRQPDRQLGDPDGRHDRGALRDLVRQDLVRPAGTWKPYNGGGIYDPSDATGGHFNHIHVSLY